jgi:flagellin|tara:strand:- start:185 stop:1018 length:834 start_codon:yes stop_codon:yes gene_type:complete
MAVVINTNYAAVLARKNLAQVQREMDKSVERLSSGKRINNASDDAAGSAIAGRMESQIRGLTMGIRHAKDGQSLVGTAEGAMQELNKILQRMRELAVQSSSGVANPVDRDYLNLEMAQLVSQVDAISVNTKFNSQNVLTGGTFTFYTDIDIRGATIVTPGADMAASALAVSVKSVSIGGGVDQADLSNVVSAIDNALASVDNKRASLGAVANRFDHIIDNLQNVIMNTVSSKSRIVDTDFSIETTNLTRNTVLQQAATSMLAQANAQKNSILSLIQG